MNRSPARGMPCLVAEAEYKRLVGDRKKVSELHAVSVRKHDESCLKVKALDECFCARVLEVH